MFFLIHGIFSASHPFVVLQLFLVTLGLTVTSGLHQIPLLHLNALNLVSSGRCKTILFHIFTVPKQSNLSVLLIRLGYRSVLYSAKPNAIRSVRIFSNSIIQCLECMRFRIGFYKISYLLKLFTPDGTGHCRRVYSFKYNQQNATLYNILYYCKCSTCFRRFLCSSSGAQKLYRRNRVYVCMFYLPNCCVCFIQFSFDVSKLMYFFSLFGINKFDVHGTVYH